MPRPRKYLPQKPGKEELLVPPGRGNPSSIKEAVAGMRRGDVRVGVLGKQTEVASEPQPEKLDVDGIARKRAIQSLLAKVITPVSLSVKSTLEADRRSLVHKLNKLTLEELKRFLPESVEVLTTSELQADISEVEKAEIQTRYMDLSP